MVFPELLYLPSMAPALTLQQHHLHLHLQEVQEVEVGGINLLIDLIWARVVAEVTFIQDMGKGTLKARTHVQQEDLMQSNRLG